MHTGRLQILGDAVHQGSASGVVIETYEDPRFYVPDRTDAPPMNVEALKGFRGYRVTHCASGRFLTINMGMKNAYIDGDLYSGLAQTEFLRSDIQSGRQVGFSNLRDAVFAVFPKAEIRVFGEKAETCGCNAYFPGLRPASMTPYDQRVDLGGYRK